MRPAARPALRSAARPAGRPAPRPGARARASWAEPQDPRRLFAAILSAVVPGLGQALNGRRWLAPRLALPFLVVVGIAGLVVATQSPTRLVATLVAPLTMTILLAVNGAILALRLGATLHAFFDARYPGRPGRLGALGLAIVVVLTAAPHVVLHGWGDAGKRAFERVFTGELALADGSGTLAAGTRDPGLGERINVLVLGIDKTPWRTATLTDTMLVVSVDPTGAGVSMVSLPRDLVDVPLGEDDTFHAKLNSLMSYADRHPDAFPEGGIRTLEDAVGDLLGIRIHYYALMDFVGFVKMVDALGGVDIDVAHGFFDPEYDGYGFTKMGWGVEPGPHHFKGYEALAYARARKGATETDFKRQARQQEILLALRDRALEGGSLLFHLPELLGAVGEYVRTDIPPSRLPELAALAEEIDSSRIVRIVIQRPLVRGGVDDRLGSVQWPELELIREMAGVLFPAPGTPAQPWPTPAPSTGAAAAP